MGHQVLGNGLLRVWCQNGSMEKIVPTPIAFVAKPHSAVFVVIFDTEQNILSEK